MIEKMTKNGYIIFQQIFGSQIEKHRSCNYFKED